MPVAAIIPALTALASIASTVVPKLMGGGGAKPAQAAPLASPGGGTDPSEISRTGGTLGKFQPKGATTGFLEKGVGAGTSGPSADALRDLL